MKTTRDMNIYRQAGWGMELLRKWALKFISCVWKISVKDILGYGRLEHRDNSVTWYYQIVIKQKVVHVTLY